MNITIIGWYGTETIGDRAILAGILSFLFKSFSNCNIFLGSLYPFFTERTLKEDVTLWENIINNKINVELFDSQDRASLDKSINKSELIIMGGGPLMHIDPVFMVEYAFKIAKRKHKKTAILGCGIGPLFTLKHQKSVVSIVDTSDLVILRDNLSLKNLKHIYNEHNKDPNLNKISVSHDPAVECALLSMSFLMPKTDHYIAVNLRSFPGEYLKSGKSNDINTSLVQFLRDLAIFYSNTNIYLFPMHYFHIGGDDRTFLNKAAFEVNKKNICVQNEPLSLSRTMEAYYNADICIGMRFHSVVLQTLLNGKNYILDYTEPQKGKILGFVKDIDVDGFLKKRYLNLQDTSTKNISFDNFNQKFEANVSLLSKQMDIYVQKLQSLEF